MIAADISAGLAAGRHQVQLVPVGKGAVLFRIGLRYGIAYEDLGAYNGIPAPYVIYEGQEIRIPPQG